jgi:hypothetical protein
MADSKTRAERLAHNTILILIARVAMIGAVPLLGWNAKTLIDLQAAVHRIPDQIFILETRLAGQIGTVEDRIRVLARRGDTHEQRIERLERPFFEPRRAPP